MNKTIIIVSASIFVAFFSPGWLDAAEIALSKGQTVYVPVYSNVMAGLRQGPVHLSNALIIRNTDIHNEVQVMYADYYDTKGRLIKKLYPQPVKLAPLETVYIYLSEGDKEGGVGANFIISWHTAKTVNPPIIEGVMIGSAGLSFVSPSQIIDVDTN